MANGPLKDEDLTEINNSLKALDTADGIIDQAMRAGIDIADKREESRQSRERLLRIKQAFFPGQ